MYRAATEKKRGSKQDLIIHTDKEKPKMRTSNMNSIGFRTGARDAELPPPPFLFKFLFTCLF